MKSFTTAGQISVFVFNLFVSANLFAAPATTTIQDNAAFFNKDVIRRALDEMKEINKQYKKEIIVETVREVPVGDEKNIGENSQTIDPLFSQWAKKKLARATGNSIYIVIAKKPSYIMAAVGSETRTKGEFTENDRNAMIRLLADSFQQRDYNKGLLESIRFIRGSLDHNINGAPAVIKQAPLPAPTSPNVTFLWRWIGFGCAALLAVLLVTGLIRGFNTPIPVNQEKNP